MLAKAFTLKRNVGNHMGPVFIFRSAYLMLLQVAEQRLPFEACGLAAGTKEGVTQIIEIKNVADDPRAAFAFHPEQWIRELAKIKEDNLLWLGVFHTHPSGSLHPSKKDSLEWHYPELAFWIVSTDKKNKIPVKCYRYRQEQFYAASIVIL